jgi:hypothetical protein
VTEGLIHCAPTWFVHRRSFAKFIDPEEHRLDGHCQVVDLVWCCQDWSFVAIAARYKGYRYPIEVIGHAVWLYHRFTLSLRDVEELMLARGVVVTYETIRSWCAKFGPCPGPGLRLGRRDAGHRGLPTPAHMSYAALAGR